MKKIIVTTVSVVIGLAVFGAGFLYLKGNKSEG